MLRRIGVILYTMLAVLWRGYAKPEPRHIRFSEHPFVKRGHSKVIGGGGSIWSLIGISPRSAARAFATVAALMLMFALTAKLIALNADGALLAMPGLLAAKELRVKRANLAKQAEEILTAPAGENGELTAEQRTTFDRIHTDIASLKGDIDRIEAHEQLQSELNESRGGAAGRQDTSAPTGDAEQRAQQEDAAFRSWLAGGMDNLTPEQRSIMQTRRYVDKEQRAQTVTTTGGGYLIPQGFSNKLEESLKEFGGMREAATVFKTDSGNTLPYPTVDDTAQSGELLAINTQVTNQDFTFGVINFLAYKYSSKQVLVPVELLQDSAFDLYSFLAKALATRIGRITNLHFTTGDNSSKPQGVVTGASSGHTAASATAITALELLDLQHSVDPAYRKSPSAGYMFNDTTFKALRKLVDSEGRPLWQAGVGQGAPDTIWGKRYWINQDVANAATTTKPVLFGAFSKYMIRDVKDIAVLRLVERYADYHQVGFLAFMRCDGRVLDAGTDPIKFLTMA